MFIVRDVASTSLVTDTASETFTVSNSLDKTRQSLYLFMYTRQITMCWSASLMSRQQVLLQIDPRAVARKLDPKEGKRSLSPVCSREEGLTESQLVICKVQVTITCD